MFSPSLYQQLQGKSDVCLRDPVRPVLPKAKAKAKTVKRRTAARTLAAKAKAKAKAGAEGSCKKMVMRIALKAKCHLPRLRKRPRSSVALNG